MNPSGSTLGKYQIIREIARSNDIVYEAYDPIMNRRVAVKELNIPAGTSEQQRNDRIDRFKREAKALGTLQHPNIMTVYEFGVEGERHFIAMEFLDGCTLRDKIDSKGTFEPTETFATLTEVLKGLGYAHSKGIIHRDVKPDNIQLLSDGRIKITDFGIARLTFEPNITVDGQTFGTPSYMSPEQVIGKDIDFRSDLFSVGVISYEMIAGHKPFVGDSVVSLSHAILNTNPAPLSNAPYSVDHVVHKALEKTPNLRYSSAEDMITGMDDALNGQAANPWGTQLNAGNPTGQFDPFSQQPGQYNPNAQTGYPYTGYASSAPPPVISPGQYNGYQAPAYSAPPSLFSGQTQSQYGYSNSPGYNHVVSGPYVPQGAASSQYGYVPNPNGQPIYVVRPRQMVSESTRSFFRILMWALILLGSFILVLVFLVEAVGGSLKAMKVQQTDYQRAQYVQRSTQNLPINQQIAAVQRSSDSITSPIIKEEQNQYLAKLYQERAQAAVGSSDFGLAEEALKAAEKLDPQNQKYKMSLARLYQSAARSIQDAQNRAVLWQQSANQWAYASAAAGSEEDRLQFQNNAIRADLSGAQDYLDSGNISAARSAYTSALNLNPTDPNLVAQMKHMQAMIATDSESQN